MQLAPNIATRIAHASSYSPQDAARDLLTSAAATLDAVPTNVEDALASATSAMQQAADGVKTLYIVAPTHGSPHQYVASFAAEGAATLTDAIARSGDGSFDHFAAAFASARESFEMAADQIG